MSQFIGTSGTKTFAEVIISSAKYFSISDKYSLFAWVNFFWAEISLLRLANLVAPNALSFALEIFSYWELKSSSWFLITW